ncbi:MAG: hypothetical protein ABSG76_15375 [Xanthobacteraceae bacterium]
MALRKSTGLDRVRELLELEAENARLHRMAVDLTAHVLALQDALGRAAGPRRPAGVGGGEPSRLSGG